MSSLIHVIGKLVDFGVIIACLTGKEIPIIRLEVIWNNRNNLLHYFESN